jgi:hypothetical protein
MGVFYLFMYGSIQYAAELSPNVRTKEVERIVDQTCQKIVLALRQRLHVITCRIPAGTAKFILSTRVQQKITQGTDLQLGTVLTDTANCVEFEVIVGDQLTPSQAQAHIWNVLNLSPDVHNAVRFEHEGETCIVTMVNAGEFFNQAQLDILEKKGIQLTKINDTSSVTPVPPDVIDVTF